MVKRYNRLHDGKSPEERDTGSGESIRGLAACGLCGLCAGRRRWGAGGGKSWSRVRPVEENAPGLVLFGTDGGLETFGFEARDKRMEVVMVPFTPMEWKAIVPCGAKFAGFLQNSRRGDCFPTGKIA